MDILSIILFLINNVVLMIRSLIKFILTRIKRTKRNMFILIPCAKKMPPSFWEGASLPRITLSNLQLQTLEVGLKTYLK